MFNITSRLKSFVKAYHKFRAMRSNKRMIKSHLKNLKNRRYLTAEQKNEIQDFYKSLIGREIDLYSHEYFYSRTGIYSKEYIPTHLHRFEIIPRANRLSYRPVYNNKTLFDVYLKDIRHPKSILKRMNGYYYYDGKPVSEEDAVACCSNLENVIIKPVIEANHGEGVLVLNSKDGKTNIDGLYIKELFEKYGSDFMIQERVKQHEKINALNPTSVNTLRIVTYRSGMDILLVYAVIRIGKQGATIDNQCAGGISVGVKEDGKLEKYAFGGYEADNVVKTDTGIDIENYEIPSYDKAIETVKRLHYQLPFFNFVGWDIAIAEDGEPVLIEWNSKVELSQSAFGPGYGKYTERIIRELWDKKPNN